MWIYYLVLFFQVECVFLRNLSVLLILFVIFGIVGISILREWIFHEFVLDPPLSWLEPRDNICGLVVRLIFMMVLIALLHLLFLVKTDMLLR